MELNDSLPSGATIDRASLESLIVSTYDHINGLRIDFPGTLEANSSLIINVPYTAKSIISIPAYSMSVPIYDENTQDGETGIVATFSWAEQPYLAEGSGVFRAKITITDGNIKDGAYNAKKLDVQNDAGGIAVATFRYPKDDSGSTGEATLKVIPAIRDRMFRKKDNNGDTKTHSFLYLPVTNRITGRTWLNNNLGAEYADTTNPNGNFNYTQQATAWNDHLAYGSLFQWGRKADGHELINWTNGSAGNPKHGITEKRSDEPTDALFIGVLWDFFVIHQKTQILDWRVNQDNTLWANESSPNNVCPVGYRLPTQGEEGTNKEWEVEVDSWHTDDAHDNTNATHALTSTLKLSMPGYRDRFGDLRHMGIRGNYWSSSNNEIYSYKLYLVPIKTIGFSGDADATASHYLMPIKTFDFLYRSTGFSARCIKD
jgi:hypothetical protein